MKRIAFLGSCALPFHLRYWMEFLPNWIDEIDEVILDLQQIPKEHKKYLVNKAKAYKKLTVIETPKNPWPQSITDNITNSSADTILILHDDTFILKKGVIDNYFTIAEKGKVVTPMHGIYSPTDYVNRILNEMYPKYLKGLKDYSFLLYFLFMPRSFFMATSGYLGGSGWKVGEWVYQLGRRLEENVAGDTGFKLCLELFMNQVPFHPIERQTTAEIQFKDDPLKELQAVKYDGWVHFQNMANTLPAWFDGSHGWRNTQNKTDPIMRAFMYMRLAYMQEFLDVDDYEEIEDDAIAVQLEMIDIQKAFDLDEKVIDQYQKEIRRILCVA